MPPSLRLALCLAALFPARVALADDNGNVKVDVVVNMTEEGRKRPRPTPDNPAYYYPVVRGYTQGGAIISNQPPPPATLEVEGLIRKELARQGYLLATNHPPSLVLLFWWGYKAPETMGPSGDSIEGGTIGLPGGASANGSGLPTNISANHNEMEELVFGSDYAPDFMANAGSHPSIRLENLTNESRVARYYMMVSAMDFKAATEKKPLLLWTARISTPLWSHTLEQVLPTLLAVGGPALGRDTDGPQITTESLVPMGHVIVGTPVMKTDAPAGK